MNINVEKNIITRSTIERSTQLRLAIFLILFNATCTTNSPSLMPTIASQESSDFSLKILSNP